MADKRNIDSGERKFRNRSDKYRAERQSKLNSSAKRRSSTGGNRIPRSLTEEERREYRRRKARIKKRREAVRNVRILFACVALVFMFLVFKAFAGIVHFIEKSRTEQKGAIETVVESSISEGLSEESGEGQESASETAESASEDNGLVLSGGRYIDPSKPMVALTFDDGPDVQVDSILMDELEKVNGRSTFFVVGQRVEKFPEDIKNTVERGHEVGNHSYDHDIHLSKKGVDYIRNEFDKTDQAVQNASGVAPALVRLPGGNYTADVKTAVSKPLIFWSIDTEDWRSRDAEKTKQIVLSQVKDGDIVLMHALYLSTAEACKAIIPELTARGYQLVTVSEMIRFRGQDVAGGNGIQYKHFPPVATETQAASTESTVSVVQSSASTQSAGTSASKSAETKAKSSTESTKSKKSSSESSSSTKKNNTSSTKESTKSTKESTKSTKESTSATTAQTTAERNPATAAPETSALAPANFNGAIDAEDPH